MAKARPPRKGSFKALAAANNRAIEAANSESGLPFSINELAAQAAAMARSQVAAQQAALQDQIASLNSQGTKRANVATGAYAGLGRLLSSIGPQIRDTYNQAASAQQQAGQGFSDSYRALADQNAQTDAQFLQNLGAPQGQQDAITGRSSGADALYGLGGYIPSTSMGREGTAWSAYGSTLPASSNRMGQMEVSDILRANAEQAGPLNAELGSLNASIPGIQAGIQNDLFKQQMDTWQAMDSSKLQWEALNLSKKELGIKTKAEKAAAKADQQNTDWDNALAAGIDPQTGQPLPPEEKKLSVSFSKENGYYTYVDGTPKLDAQGRKIPYGKGGGKTDSNKLSRDDWSSLNKGVSRQADIIYGQKQTVDNILPNGKQDLLNPTKDVQLHSRSAAFAKIWQQYALSIPKNNQRAKARLRKLINDMLTQAGYDPPPRPAPNKYYHPPG